MEFADRQLLLEKHAANAMLLSVKVAIQKVSRFHFKGFLSTSAQEIHIQNLYVKAVQ